MTQDLKKLKNRLERIERELEKVRGCSPLSHGWQTQKYAKASRKWDELGKEKFQILIKLEELGYEVGTSPRRSI